MCKDKPATYLLDGIMSDAEVQQYFAGGAAPASSAPAGKKFTVGISNPFISSEYRTQMIQELKDINKEYADKGVANDLVIESADTDVAGQIQQLQNLISKKVDAILVNPGDVNGLNDTLKEACDKGIIVISVDQELNVPCVYNVGIDQKEWAKTSAQVAGREVGRQGRHRGDRRLPRPPGERSAHGRRGGSAEELSGHQGAGDRHAASGTKPRVSR